MFVIWIYRGYFGCCCVLFFHVKLVFTVWIALKEKLHDVIQFSHSNKQKSIAFQKIERQTLWPKLESKYLTLGQIRFFSNFFLLSVFCPAKVQKDLKQILRTRHMTFEVKKGKQSPNLVPIRVLLLCLFYNVSSSFKI